MATVTINGTPHEIRAAANRKLLGFLRSSLGLLGAKPGCGEGECGACTVLIDGKPALACQTSLSDITGRTIITIEGLATLDGLHPIQRALIDERASQCGYCTPGMALRAAALLSENPTPDDNQIVAAMNTNVCRCGCYLRLVRAIHRASAGTHLSDNRLDYHYQSKLGENTLARPNHPWDLSRPEERDWFNILGEGLVVVWPPSPEGARTWPRTGGAWLHIGPNGHVTAFTGKVDVGQDNYSAFRLIVAEELCVAFNQVEAILGDTDLCPWDIGTFGSRSMPDSGEALRRAAAGGRAILVALAAKRWSINERELSAANGEVTGGPSGERLGYGDLVRSRRQLEVLDAEPELRPSNTWTLVGAEGHLPERQDAVTGARRFVSDFELPGMLHGAVLRPPIIGGTLSAVDIDEASSLPGANVIREGTFIGAVAEDPITARRAVASIHATWKDPTPGPDDVIAYLRAHPKSGQGWENALDESVGDVEQALSSAPSVVEASYRTAFIAHVPLETRSAMAKWENERVTIWVGTQVPFGVRRQAAIELGIDEADVRVIVPPTGGGFGGKHAGEVAIEAAKLARNANRPVKVHWNREEEFRWGYLRPMAIIDIRASLDSRGSLSGWDFLNINSGIAGIAMPYSIPNMRLRFQPAASPVPQGSYRALAATANAFARECHIDELAEQSGVDPIDFRLANLDDERLSSVIRAVAERFGWKKELSGSGRGFGFAAGLEKGGRVATAAEVTVGGDGEVTIRRIVTAYECGAVVNRDTVMNQIEGGTIMALGGALFEEVDLEHGHIASPTLSHYRIPRFSDIPDIETVLLDRPDIPFAGAGETPLIAVAPAIANAINAASGVRLRSLPLIPNGKLP